MSKSSLEAAAEAAARVNAMLIAKGKLKLPPNQIKPKIGHLTGERVTDDLVTAEVEINDAPLGARNLLTRGHTQDEICKYSGAAISTRGRYMTFDEKLSYASGDRPLYLHVQAPKQESVDLAVSRILKMIAQYDKSAAIKIPVTNISPVNKPLTETSLTPVAATGMHFVQEKVFIGLEAPPSFPVRDKILGPGGSYLQHIKMETGANVTLRGRGSGYIEPTSGREAFEPLYIHLTHPKPEGLNAAKVLAMNLVDTVHVEYAQWQQQRQPIMTVPMGPAQIAYQSIIAPAQVSVPQVLPLPTVSVAPDMSYPVVASSAPLMTPVLTATVENVFTSSASTLALPTFQPEYANALALNQVSSIGEMTPILSEPMLSSSPFTRPIEVLTNHVPMMLPPEAHTPLNVSLSTSTVPPPSVIPMQTEIPVFPTAQHQILVSHHPGPDFHQAAPIQMSPFNPQLRLTCASPNSITFPPPSPMMTHPPIITTNYLNPDVKFENEILNNKRKFMEDPDSIRSNIGLQDPDVPFNRVLATRPRMMMPPPPPPVRPPRPQHFRAPRFPIPQRNKRDYNTTSDTAKTESVVEKFSKSSTEKAETTENDNAKEHCGALGGLAVIYGSDDSDDEITNNPVPTLKRKI